MWAIMDSTLDLVSAFVDFLMVSSVSVPALHFAGILLVAFLLGLLLGRLTRRGVRQAVEQVPERNTGRVSLDFAQLTPIGPSDEENAAHSAMDISDLRVDRGHQPPVIGDHDEEEEPTLLKE